MSNIRTAKELLAEQNQLLREWFAKDLWPMIEQANKTFVNAAEFDLPIEFQTEEEADGEYFISRLNKYVEELGFKLEHIDDHHWKLTWYK